MNTSVCHNSLAWYHDINVLSLFYQLNLFVSSYVHTISQKNPWKKSMAAPAGSGGIRQVWIGNSSDMAHYVHRRFGRRSVVRGPRGPGLLGIRGSARLADFHIE